MDKQLVNYTFVITINDEDSCVTYSTDKGYGYAESTIRKNYPNATYIDCIEYEDI